MYEFWPRLVTSATLTLPTPLFPLKFKFLNPAEDVPAAIAVAAALLFVITRLLFLLELAESFLFSCTARAFAELRPVPDLARPYPRLLFDLVPVTFEPANREGSVISPETSRSSFYKLVGLSIFCCFGGKLMLGSSVSLIWTSASLKSFVPPDLT